MNRRGFTLIELILVMSMMLVILSLTLPSFSGFFRGRALESEVRRFVSLTHYAQSRAVSEGVPMVLWIDKQQKAYGLEAEYSYSGVDDKSVTYNLDHDLEMEPDLSTLQNASTRSTQKVVRPTVRGQTSIRFQPDGFVSENGLEALRFYQVDPLGKTAQRQNALWVALSPTRISFEVQTNSFLNARR